MSVGTEWRKDVEGAGDGHVMCVGVKPSAVTVTRAGWKAGKRTGWL
jgi:hypothetical protein